MFDFKYSIGREDVLPIVAARHMVILFHAFPNLQKLDNSTRSAVIDHFIDSNLLEVQDWKNCKTAFGATITKTNIRSEMSKYADLDSSKCRMKTDSEITTILSQGKSV